VSISNLDKDTGCPDRYILWFSSTLPGRFWHINLTRPHPNPSKSFPVQYSPINIQFDATESDLIALSNKAQKKNLKEENTLYIFEYRVLSG
jgi:hypothetical protein